MRVLLVALLLMVLSTAHGADGVPVTIVNYSDLPVNAHAVELDLDGICKRLGVPSGSAIAVSSSDGKESFPAAKGSRDGRAVAWVYLSMKPRAKLDLVARTAQKWPDKPELVMARANQGEITGEMRNGVVRMKLSRNGWMLGFDPQPGSEIPPARDPLASPAEERKRGNDTEPWTVIHRGGLEFWIDNTNRGRITNNKPDDLGLVPFPGSTTLESCTSSVGEDGTPSITLVRRMGGFAKGVKVTETFELPPGLPILICRIRWDNEGTDPLWIAYVGSGTGIKGTWGPTLMDDPLVQRMKTPLKGYLNGAETRPSWLGGMCKVSMESQSMGCGVGLSTLLPTPGKVGTGSMIWGINRSGFQVNLIDPEIGQFPFPLQPKETRLNGAAFLLTQNSTSTYRQVCALWEALAAGRTPQLHSPCAVYVDGVPSQVQTVATTQDIRPLLLESGGDLTAALRLDFNRHYVCSGKATIAGTPVEAVLRPRDPKAKATTAGTITATGEFSFDLNAAATKADELPFLLEFKHGAGAITSVAIVETMIAIPEPWSPLDGAMITDIATMFRWKAIPLVVDYELQLSKTADFAAPIDIKLPMSADQPWYTPPQEKLPDPGMWYWRIRGVKGPVLGPWSPARSFTVNRDYDKKLLVRPVSPEQPLFTLEASRWNPYTNFVSDMPVEIRPHVAIVVEGFIGEGLTIDQALKGVAAIPHPFLMRTHPPTQITLADIEWVCQKYPNFVGIQGGETIKKVYEKVRGDTGDGDYHRRMVRILAKYGRFYHEADGTYKDDAWQDLWDQQSDFLKEYGQYIVFTQKNNIIRRQFYTQSAVMGLWLGGITLAHGAWEDGGFYWQNAGFNGLDVCQGERSGQLRTMPRIFWTLMCVQGIARGCSIYSLDGQTLMYGIKEAARSPTGPWKSALWNDKYETTDTFKRFVVPVVQATIAHRLVPGKAELLKDIKLAVYNDKTAKADAVTWSHYVEYGPLYAGTYGFKKMKNIDGQLWEIFPNTGRYHFIPVLPQGDVPLGPEIKNVPVSQLQDVAAVKALFDATYPAWYDGDAFAGRAGDTITVMNGNENQDEAQSYKIPVQSELVTTLSGKIQVHSYVLAKVEDQGKRFWLQANTEYPERDTELSITCSRKPEWKVQPVSAATEAVWDEAAKSLKLRLSHKGGGVEVELR
ncbi:MAG: hypothetical protein NTW87_00885 [Planctomycetota bacterium]|nr:hypothetical protein [Planctomycetota bacterium]